ncbi:SpoIID/LytB domain-containing protein [Candidatus Babeliales bacterium]|nr:SpoIID/LytB domain-containing protein [Candidatus Babeliales bacterium]MBP9843560.1 SpoIID/LytB domain-containing protein [Candidatus Babeliales bacterium]
MILLFNFCLFFSCFFSALDAFDVRVLLEKFIISDATLAECKLSSQHGMIISGMQDPLVGPISIICTDNEFIINGISLPDEMLTINPALPANYEKKIQQFVISWEKENHDICQKRLSSLAAFYEKFVNDRNFRDYALLYEVMQRCIDECIGKFIESIEHPVISYDSLIVRAHEQLSNRLKILLTTAVYEKKASKSLMQQLQSSEKIRTDFFVKILESILVQFLTDYLVGLPHKIIQQAMKDETGCLLFDKNKYLGTFYLVRDGNAILLINSLDIDDYLLSVVHSEGWPGWPMEVYKTQVIASRTYLVEKILKANKAKRPYHIVNSIKHQTYKGHHKFTQLKQAVDETRNVFISYKGEPIVAMFDACCGGVVPAKIEGPDYKNHPYLARTKACHHCKKYKIYEWKKELSKLEITELLRQDHPDLPEITDMRVTKRDSAGLVKQVLVTTKQKNFYVAGKKMYSLFPAIKSFSYTIKKKGKLFLFHGKGFGHHMGLCQWGSLGMVQDNWNYTKILQFYYPGTEFMKLSLTR